MRHLTIALLALAALFAGQVSAQTLPESIARGKAVYDANCVNCHLGDGKGAKPLDGSKVVLYDTAAQLKKVLDGAVGMPSWADLTDAQIADVITYTKNTWTNQTGVLLAPSTAAQARLRSHSCFQAQFLVPRAPSAPARLITTEAGSVLAYWCVLPTRQGDVPNKIYWTAQGFATLKKYTSNLALIAAAGRVGVASDSWDQLGKEIIAIQVKPAPGSQDAYELERLSWLGCEALRTGPPPNDTAFDTPLAANYCGPAPVAPPPPPPPPPTTERWATPAYGTYRLYAVVAGRLGTAIVGRTAAPNQACDCRVTKIASGTSTYCPVAAAAAQTEVTLCKRVP